MSTAVIETTRSVPANNGSQRAELSQEAQSFELAQRKATLLSKSTLVPKEFQGNISNCFIAMNMATRLGADVIMVMQNLYIVHGRPGWSSQFLIATFNISGRFSAMRFEFVGDSGKPTYGCRAWAVEKETSQRLEGCLITIDMAQKEGWLGKNGSKWQTMPNQMLMYRAASFFVRAYAPEISMGLHTADELEDIDLPRVSNVISDEPALPEIVYASKSDELAAKLKKPEPEKVSHIEECAAWLKSESIDCIDSTPEGTYRSYGLPNERVLCISNSPPTTIPDGSDVVDAMDADALEQVKNIVEKSRKKRA